jgi:hypothetical protein
MSQTQPGRPEATTGSSPTAPISAGTLFYLWGDRLVDSAGALGSTTLPSGAKVSAKQLAPLLFAVSFARLQAEGVLRAEVTTKKTLGLTDRQVQVTPAAHPGPRAGFEHVVVQRMMAGATTARTVVGGWYDREVNSPESRVFGLAKQEMVTAGLGVMEQNARRGFEGVLLGKTKVEPVPDRVNATWSHFEQFQAWWQSYSRHDPALVEVLVDSCRKAIRGARPQGDHL